MTIINITNSNDARVNRVHINISGKHSFLALDFVTSMGYFLEVREQHDLNWKLAMSLNCGCRIVLDSFDDVID